MVDNAEDPSGLTKTFRNALRKAWEDGRISYDERNIIAEFSDGLPISSEKVSELEAREYLRYRWRDYETTPHDIQLSLIEKALLIDDENDFLWMKKGSLIYMMGDVEGSLGPLERSLELDPLNEEAWFWKGVALTSHGDMEAAMDCFERAVEQESDHTLSWVMLSRLERRFGDLEKSKACATRAIESFPEHPSGFIERALTHLSLGRKEEAANDISMALERDPDNGRAAKVRSMIEEGSKKAPIPEPEVLPPEVQIPQRKGAKKGPKVSIETQPGVEGTSEQPPASAEPLKATEPPTEVVKMVESESPPEELHDDPPPKDIAEPGETGKPVKRPSYLDDDMFDEGPTGSAPSPEPPIADVPGKGKDDGEGSINEEIEEEPVEIVYKLIPCPKCGSGVPITTEERPVVVVCPSCGAKGRITK